jgi:hypothetical protein
MYEIVVVGAREEPPGEAAGDVPLRAEGGPSVIPPTKSGAGSAVILRRTFAAGSNPSSAAAAFREPTSARTVTRHRVAD